MGSVRVQILGTQGSERGERIVVGDFQRPSEEVCHDHVSFERLEANLAQSADKDTCRPQLEKQWKNFERTDQMLHVLINRSAQGVAMKKIAYNLQRATRTLAKHRSPESDAIPYHGSVLSQLREAMTDAVAKAGSSTKDEVEKYIKMISSSEGLVLRFPDHEADAQSHT